MKKDSGITLTSLIIYVIGMVIVVGTIANLTSFFYRNINVDDIKKDTATQYTKFTSIFSKEIDSDGNYIVDCKTTNNDGVKLSYIIFASGNQYTYTSENNCIYKNNVKMCEFIDDCTFSYKFENSKYVISVDFKTASMDMTGNNAMKFRNSNF